MKICFRCVTALPFLVILAFSTLQGCKTTGLTIDQQKVQLEKLRWITGLWQNNEGETLMQEDWRKVNDTLYSGLGIMVMAGDTVFREELSITTGKRHIYYKVSMMVNEKPYYSSFVMTRNTASTCVFEDSGNEDLSRLTYKKKGTGQLLITTEGHENGEPVKESFVLTRVK